MRTLRGERLRMAREKRYKSARLAAKAMGIAVSTYGAHERAETPGGRDYGPDEARKYARRFGVTPEWLLTGREPFPEGDEPPPPKIPVVGYVGAGATAHFYDVPQAHLDEITPPVGLAGNTAGGGISRGNPGPVFNPWDAFLAHRRPP